MNLKHPFLIKIKEMGWTPRMEQEREYPKGEFHHAVFIKTYIRICHEVGTMRKKTRKGIQVTCARLRIHGSKNLSKIWGIIYVKRMIPMIHNYTSNISREQFELIREDLEN
ncbi:hypothetical protein Q0N88_33955, partial [Bacillus thuringiensis]